MSDIVLLEGNNELNVAMLPLAVFEYASDIRVVSPTLEGANFALEFDVKNISSASAVYNAWTRPAWASTQKVTPSAGVNVAPNEVVTIHKEWYVAGGTEGQAIPTIYSEAGILDYFCGVARYSIDIPSQIPSGSEYWATASVFLRYFPNTRYNIRVYLRNKELLPYVEESLDACGFQVSTPIISGYKVYPHFILTTDNFYTGGLYTGMPEYGIPYMQIPAVAQYQVGTRPPEPLPPGIYDIVLEVRTYQYSGDYVSHASQWMIPPGDNNLRKVFTQTIGQVEII